MPAEERERQLARVNAFSDGLFAIAATLLVLSIDVPNGPAARLNGELRDLAEPVAIYFLSFAVIGLLWVRHHELFGLYAALIIILAALLRLLWLDALRRGLAPGRESQQGAVRNAVATFGASIPVAFASPSAAEWMWLLAVVVPVLVGLRARRRSRVAA